MIPPFLFSPRPGKRSIHTRHNPFLPLNPSTSPLQQLGPFLPPLLPTHSIIGVLAYSLNPVLVLPGKQRTKERNTINQTQHLLEPYTHKHTSNQWQIAKQSNAGTRKNNNQSTKTSRNSKDVGGSTESKHAISSDTEATPTPQHFFFFSIAYQRLSLYLNKPLFQRLAATRNTSYLYQTCDVQVCPLTLHGLDMATCKGCPGWAGWLQDSTHD